MKRNYFFVLFVIAIPCAALAAWLLAQFCGLFTPSFVKGFNEGANGDLVLQEPTVRALIFAGLCILFIVIAQRITLKIAPPKSKDTPKTTENQDSEFPVY